MEDKSGLQVHVYFSICLRNVHSNQCYLFSDKISAMPRSAVSNSLYWFKKITSPSVGGEAQADFVWEENIKEKKTRKGGNAKENGKRKDMGNFKKIKGGMEAKKGGGCVPKKGNVWSETLPVPLLSALETAFSMISCIFRKAGNL